MSDENATNDSPARPGESLARALGWFSIALGLAEVLAPQQICDILGMSGKAALVRGYGVREIGAGAALLTQPDPYPWMWSRVAGDGLDLATLAGANTPDNPKREQAGFAFALVAGITALDIACTQQLARR